jgi:ATP-dependent DNA helicase RecG
VNAPRIPEVTVLVFEELLVNALIHRDYLVSAPIRLFIFQSRIEIISPGHLPDNLTVEKIRLGNSIIRNPILVSYAAEEILPYRCLGSGIKRAMEAWPEIEFMDDREGSLFTVTVRRKQYDRLEMIGVSSAGSEKVQRKKAESDLVSEIILALVGGNPNLSAKEIAGRI